MGEHAALRGVRIDVIEMLEVRRIFKISERRHAVTFGVLRGVDIPGERRCERSRGEDKLSRRLSSKALIIEAFRSRIGPEISELMCVLTGT
jgi:hypothetical protein